MDWTLSVSGTAPDIHKEADADKLADAFVQQLKDAGHSITAATFTHAARPEPVAVDKLAQVQSP